MKSRKIARRVLAVPAFKQAIRVLIYKALKSEVDTDVLIRECLRDGKEVYIPSVVTRRQNLEIFRITNVDRDFRRGVHGLLEPRRYKARKGDISEIQVAVIPGLGFDASGTRLGRGLGYFDRCLGGAKHVYKIGLCFREQFVGKVPAEPHDVHMDIVIHD